MMKYYTYILISEATEKLYIGSTQNLEDRLHRHNQNWNTYTKGRGPWMIIYNQASDTRKEAVALEKYLKSKKSKDRVMDWIKSQSELRIPPGGGRVPGRRWRL